jgi:hypothetical protein
MKIAKRYVINNVTVDSSKLPNVLRLYPSVNERELLLLKDKDGAFPFFIKLFNNTLTGSPNSGFNNFSDILNNKKRRVSKEYIEENFWVYNIPTDYGHQSLSPGFDDFIPVCYDNDGYKIPQHFIAYITNYTSKETFVIIPKNGSTVGIIKRIDILPSIYTDIDTDTYIPLIKNNDNDIYTVNMNSAEINSIDDVSVYFSIGSSNTKYQLQKSDYFINIFTYDDVNPPLSISESSTYVARQSSYTKLYGQINNNNNELIIPPYLDISNENKKYLNINIQVNSITDHTNSNNEPINLFLKNNKSGFELIRDEYQEIQKLSSLPLTENIEVYSPLPNDSTKMRRLIQGVDFYILDKKIFITPEPDPSVIFEVYVRSQQDRVLSLSFTNTNSFDIKQWLYNANITNWNIDINNSKIDLYENGILIPTSNSGLNTSRKYEFVIYDIKLGSATPLPIEYETGYMSSISIPHTNRFSNFIDYNYSIFTDPYLNTYGETEDVTPENHEAFLYNKSLNIKLEALEPYVEVQGGKHALVGRQAASMNGIIASFVTDYNKYIIQPDNIIGENTLLTLLNNVKVTKIENSIATVKDNWKESLLNYGDIDLINDSKMRLTDGIINDVNNFWVLIIKPADTIKPFNIEYYDSNQLLKVEYSCVATDGFYYSMPFFLNPLSNSAITKITEIRIKHTDNTPGNFKFLEVK